MNLDGKGWLDKYIQERKKYPLLDECTVSVTESPEKGLYQIIQPTGLLYGHPVQVPFHEHELMKRLITSNKMKVILSEGFFYPLLAEHFNEINTASQRYDLLYDSSKKVIEFYDSVYPEFSVSKTSFWGSKKPSLEVAEALILNRINIPGGLMKNFWQQFFHNCLLFLDIFYFGKWIGNSSVISLECIAREKETIRFSILMVIASAAMADGSVGREEEKLFKYFLKSAHLPAEKEKEAKELLNQGVNLEDFQIPQVEGSWLLKKYIIELATLTVWSDKIVTEEENLYLSQLCKKLDLDPKELESSMLAIESFILENWDQMHYFSKKSDYSLVSQQYVSKISQIVNQNKAKVLQEINESKELVELLAKSRRERLTDKEKKIVKAQLLDILKLIPTFMIIALPFTFITFPILLKILPKSAFPTAFQE